MDKEVNISNLDATLDVGQSTWVTINNLSVYLRAGDDGVSVSIYPAGKEEENSITETWACYSEAEGEQ